MLPPMADPAPDPRWPRVASRPLVAPRRALSLALSALFLGAVGCGDETPRTSPEPVRPSGDLVAVALFGDAGLLVAGASGQILRSDDDGATWRVAQRPPVDGLRDLAMGDALDGWAVGHGVILRTRDGGRVWSRQRLPGRAADFRLTAVSADARGGALAVGEAGRVLAIDPDGSGWRPLEVSGAESGAGWRDVACARQGPRDCVVVGAAGAFRIGADGESRPVTVGDAAGLPRLRFGSGGTELLAGDREVLVAAAEALRGRDVEWTLEARVSSREIRDLAARRAPEALFERLDARLTEVASILRAHGVADAALRFEGAPPWEVDDHLDDDPRFLERYWAERVDPAPGVDVRAVERFARRAVAIARASGALGVLGRDGVWAQSAGREGLARAGGRFRAAAHDLVWTQAGWLVAGAQGSLWRRASADASGAGDWEPVSLPAPAFFEALRALDADSLGERIVVVGDGGRLLHSEDAGRSWHVQTRAAQGDRPPFR